VPINEIEIRPDLHGQDGSGLASDEKPTRKRPETDNILALTRSIARRSDRRVISRRDTEAAFRQRREALLECRLRVNHEGHDGAQGAKVAD
jgi:hypothetical protein